MLKSTQYNSLFFQIGTSNLELKKFYSTKKIKVLCDRRYYAKNFENYQSTCKWIQKIALEWVQCLKINLNWKKFKKIFKKQNKKKVEEKFFFYNYKVKMMIFNNFEWQSKLIFFNWIHDEI